jgi:hypothetical protein
MQESPMGSVTTVVPGGAAPPNPAVREKRLRIGGVERAEGACKVLIRAKIAKNQVALRRVIRLRSGGFSASIGSWAASSIFGVSDEC